MAEKQLDANVVAIAGDWHGNVRWALSVIEELARRGATKILHVGDFGIWPGDGGIHYLNSLAGKCHKLGMTIWVTPGNHEDYDQINDPDDAFGGTERQVLRYGIEWEIALLPRGYTWEEAGRKIVSFGGAPSIDFEHRTLGRSWWKEETIRDTDLMRLEGRSEGADLMLAHDAPDGGTLEVQTILNIPPHLSMWSEAGLRYAREGRMFMNQAVEFVNPKMFVHGHYHVRGERFDEDQDRTYVSLSCDGEDGNVVILDLKTMEYQWI